MNNKFNNMFNDFLKTQTGDSIDEIELQKFIEKYNNNDIEYVNTPLDEAYEILDEALEADSDKEAVRLAKKAYKKSSACFDAIIFQADLESNSLKRMKILDEGLEFEKNRLVDEKYFEKDNIGSFYGIFETRPYIRGLHAKVSYLLGDGKLTQAKNVCNEILRLNENDNLGVRYHLMAIYALLEDEKGMLSIYKKYKENTFEMLFPMFALYYKLGDDKKAKEYLENVNKSNPNLLKFYKGKLENETEVPMPGYYSPGSASEIIMYVNTYYYLFDSLINLDDFVIENLKKKKN